MTPNEILAKELRQILLGRPIAGLGHIAEVSEPGRNSNLVVRTSKGLSFGLTIEQVPKSFGFQARRVQRSVKDAKGPKLGDVPTFFRAQALHAMLAPFKIRCSCNETDGHLSTCDYWHHPSSRHQPMLYPERVNP